MVALLAPVPGEHLVSALKTIAKEGKVAFGTRAFQPFYDLKSILEDGTTDVLIYASGPTAISGPPSVAWCARYLGFCAARGGAHPDGLKYRPESTHANPSDNKGHWALFWEVADLQELSKTDRIPISAIFSFATGNPFKKTFRPEGPVLIAV